MPDEVTLEVTQVTENVTVETTDGDTVEIKVVATQGASATVTVGTTTTGAAGSSASVTNSGSTSAAVFNFTIPRGDTGATGPNSVTSATSSDGTANLSVADLEVVGGEIYTQGDNASIYTQGSYAKIYTQGVGGEIYTDANSSSIGTYGEASHIYTEGSDSTIFTVGLNAAIFTQGDNATISTIGSAATISTAGASAHIETSHANAAVKSSNFLPVESTGASLRNGSYESCLTWGESGRNLTVPSGCAFTLAGATEINTTTISYGTGAAAAHRTALGLGTITTQDANNVAITGGAAAFTANSSVTGYLTTQLSGSTTGKVLLGAVTGIGRDYPGVWFGAATTAPATSNYALLFDSTAGTIFNSPAGLAIFFRIGNSNAITVDSTLGVGIGTTTPSAKALLDLASTTRGFLPPRMTTTQRNAITSVPAGLMIYNTTTNKLNVFTTAWEQVTSA